jgi:hypothetical protein
MGTEQANLCIERALGIRSSRACWIALATRAVS